MMNMPYNSVIRVFFSKKINKYVAEFAKCPYLCVTNQFLSIYFKWNLQH